MSTFKHKTVLITGGASGIGAAILSDLAKQGCVVIIGDITDGEDLIHKTKVETGNENLHYLYLDVTDFASQQTFFREASALSHGQIHSVVVNAGISNPDNEGKFMQPPDYTTGPLDKSPPQLKVLDVNLIGAMYTVHIATSYLSKGLSNPEQSRDRHILLMGSLAGIFGTPIIPQYATSKHGITGLFRSLRFTSKHQGFRLNMICPYFLDTPILGFSGKMLMAGAALATTHDVVDIVTRTISDESIDGRTFAVLPKSSIADAKSLGLHVSSAFPGPTDDTEERAIWECEDPDNDMLYEAFSKRILMLINLQSSRKGWLDMLTDVTKAISWGLAGLCNGKPKAKTI